MCQKGFKENKGSVIELKMMQPHKRYDFSIAQYYEPAEYASRINQRLREIIAQSIVPYHSRERFNPDLVGIINCNFWRHETPHEPGDLLTLDDSFKLQYDGLNVHSGLNFANLSFTQNGSSLNACLEFYGEWPSTRFDKHGIARVPNNAPELAVVDSIVKQLGWALIPKINVSRDVLVEAV